MVSLVVGVWFHGVLGYNLCQLFGALHCNIVAGNLALTITSIHRISVDFTSVCPQVFVSLIIIASSCHFRGFPL